MKEENKDLLTCLLQKVLGVTILDIVYLNLEQNVDNISIKRKHFDLYLKTNIGRIQVEINTEKEGYVNPRNMVYLCDIYSHVTLQGEEYSEELDIIQINFSYHLHDNELLRIYYFQDKLGKRYVSNFKTYEINMEKYMNYWYTNNREEIEKNKEIIMLDLGLEELKTLSQKDRMVKKYMEEIKRVNENPEFREYMSAAEDNRKIENSKLHAAMKRGKLESQKEIVLSMLERGLEEETIQEYTGLSLDFIKSCRE